jgi:hypothetical protein
MAESVEILLSLYKEQTEQARHHEEQRATVTNYILIVAGAVLGLLSIEGFRGHLPAGVFLIGLGLFGAIAVAKHYERNRYHSRMASAYRRQIEKLDKDTQVDRSSIRSEQEKAFPSLNKLRLFQLWITFHLFVSILGVLVIWLK